MANVVTFDPITLIIEEIDTGGDNELDVQEIYSEWKDWVLAAVGRLGYPPAFRYVGAEPISATRSLGTTYFLLNGWRIRPSERDHNLTLNGNLYLEGGGTKVTADTVGDFRVEVTRFVSNIIDTVATGGGGGDGAKSVYMRETPDLWVEQ